MTLSDVPAIAVLAIACAVFLRFGCVRDTTSPPSEGSAGGSQGEARRASSTGGPGACRHEVTP